MLGKQLQSLILELMAVWPIRVIGNIIWAILDYWARIIEVMVSKAGFSTQEPPQWAYQLTRLGEEREPNFAESQVQLNSDTSHLFIGLDLPLVSHRHTTTTEVAIPVLLPDLLDSPEAIPSQFFEERFEIYVENDTLAEPMDICLVNPDGQVLFHSQPTACPILKSWPPLALSPGPG